MSWKDAEAENKGEAFIDSSMDESMYEYWKRVVVGVCDLSKVEPSQNRKKEREIWSADRSTIQ